MSVLYAQPVFHAGDVLRKWREDQGWTVADIVKKAKLDKNTIGRAEAGRGLRTDTLERIVLALGHTMTELHTALEPWSSATRHGGDASLVELEQRVATHLDELRRVRELALKIARVAAGNADTLDELMTVASKIEEGRLSVAVETLRGFVESPPTAAAAAQRPSPRTPQRRRVGVRGSRGTS